MTRGEHTPELVGGDRRLVDLAEAALEDPNLHTDLRMRLHREITDLLRDAHGDLQAPPEPEPLERSLGGDADLATGSDGDPAHLLRAVLTDPNLHTDTRMRLHREIIELLHAARRNAAERAHEPA